MVCERCGIELEIGMYPFCGPGRDHGRGFYTAIGDECDILQKNGTKVPIRFRSKSERKRWMKENGLREFDTHVGSPGSDKSTHTRSWATMDPVTAENVRILLERAFQQKSTESPEPEMHITTYTGELTSEEAKRYGQR